MVEWAALGGAQKPGINKCQRGKCENVLLWFYLVICHPIIWKTSCLQLCDVSNLKMCHVCLCPDVLDSMARFSVGGVFNYSMLTLSDNERVLYVGAREALFALDPNNISKQLRPQVTHTHLHTLSRGWPMALISRSSKHDKCPLRATVQRWWFNMADYIKRWEVLILSSWILHTGPVRTFKFTKVPNWKWFSKKSAHTLWKAFEKNF